MVQMVRDLPILALEIGHDGQVLDCSDFFLERTGLMRSDLVGAPISHAMNSVSEEAIYRLLRSPDPQNTSANEMICFHGAGGQSILASGRLCSSVHDGAPVLHLLAIESDAIRELLDKVRDQAQVVQGFFETSSEPMWGIEFTEPVDLTQNETEIVRQVFVNDRRWIMCNAAMSRFYEIPPEIDIHDTPVSAIFPCNPTNESFVRALIHSHFNLDRSVTIDIKHDGSTKYVENNVRAHIENNYLFKMWGTARDITGIKEQQQRLAYSEGTIRNVLSALPDGVLVANRQRLIKALNPAVEQLLGLAADGLLEKDFSEFLPFPHADFSRRWANGETHRWTSDIRHLSGVVSPCDVRLAPIDSEQQGHFVIAIRPVAAKHRGRIARTADQF